MSAEPAAPAAAPTGQLEHRGVRAVQHLLEHAPASGALALWMRHCDLMSEERPPGLARGLDDLAAPVFTDGRTVYYREAFSDLPLAEQAGWVAHAMLHLALRHVPRFEALRRRLGDVDLDLYNRCADAIVNAALSPLEWLALPEGSLSLEGIVHDVLGLDQTREAALLEWDVERLYRAIDDRGPPGRAGRQRKGARSREGGARSGAAAARRDGAGRGPAPRGDDGAGDDDRLERPDGLRSGRMRQLGGGLSDLAPGVSAGEPPEEEALAAREWAERLRRAAAGDGPFSLVRGLMADLPRERTPWEQVLRTRLARGLSRRPDLSWSRPARSWLANQGRVGPGRRLPWEPGMTGSRRVPRLALVIDTSGSIGDELLARFAREVQAIVRRLEAALVVVVGDCAVRRVMRFEPGRADLRELQAAGGGGTDFTPLLLEAERQGPDLIVVLTDLDGPARHRPTMPVIWAVPQAEAARPEPFGLKLVLE
ncbi:MAG: VWA-like domain-containing protein [Ideonella sp.]|nr:VWA-like domain-containing protein [Ideonella sp.]